MRTPLKINIYLNQEPLFLNLIAII